MKTIRICRKRFCHKKSIRFCPRICQKHPVLAFSHENSGYTLLVMDNPPIKRVNSKTGWFFRYSCQNRMVFFFTESLVLRSHRYICIKITDVLFILILTEAQQAQAGGRRLQAVRELRVTISKTKSISNLE